MNNFVVEVCPKYCIILYLKLTGVLSFYRVTLRMDLQVTPETHEAHSPLEIFAFTPLCLKFSSSRYSHMAPFQN